MEIEIEAQPVVYLPSAPLFVCNFLEHLLHDRRTLWVYDDPTLSIHQFLIQIPKRCHARPESHLDSCPQSSLHVNASVVVLQFGLTPEDHQEELLVRIIPKALSVRTYLVQREHPNLVMLDLVLVGMDGMTVLKKIREHGIRVPVIILTNLSVDQKIMTGVVRDEPSYYVVKSDTAIDGIVEKVKTILGT